MFTVFSACPSRHPLAYRLQYISYAPLLQPAQPFSSPNTITIRNSIFHYLISLFSTALWLLKRNGSSFWSLGKHFPHRRGHTTQKWPELLVHGMPRREETLSKPILLSPTLPIWWSKNMRPSINRAKQSTYCKEWSISLRITSKELWGPRTNRLDEDKPKN